MWKVLREGYESYRNPLYWVDLLVHVRVVTSVSRCASSVIENLYVAKLMRF